MREAPGGTATDTSSLRVWSDALCKEVAPATVRTRLDVENIKYNLATNAAVLKKVEGGQASLIEGYDLAI